MCLCYLHMFVRLGTVSLYRLTDNVIIYIPLQDKELKDSHCSCCSLAFNGPNEAIVHCVDVHQMENISFVRSQFLHDGTGHSGDIAGLKCQALTSDASRQCRGFAGVLISRQYTVTLIQIRY